VPPWRAGQERSSAGSLSTPPGHRWRRPDGLSATASAAAGRRRL